MRNNFALPSRLMCAFACTALVIALQATAFAQFDSPPPPQDFGTITRGTAKLEPTVAYQEEDGTSNISALLQITDDGTTITVTGTATGMIPGRVYASVFYDNGSQPTHVTTAAGVNLRNACLPTEGFQPPQSFSQMVIGVWTQDTQDPTKWRLSASKSGAFDAPVPLAYLPLNQVGTISVREDTRPGMPVPNQPDPNRFRLRACGKVIIEQQP